MDGPTILPIHQKSDKNEENFRHPHFEA